MSSETINISKQEGNNRLYLTDSEGHVGKDSITTTVKPGDTVTWKLVPNGGIDQITRINPKSGSQDIFSEEPKQIDKGDPTSDWTGTVCENAIGTESYTIAYKIGSNPFVDDPKLKIDN